MTSPTMPIYTKDPAAILDYIIDWGSWLRTGETILTSTWALDPAPGSPSVPGDLVAAQTSVVSASAAVIWLEGGIVGLVYTVSNTITTSAGRTDVRSFQVDVELR